MFIPTGRLSAVERDGDKVQIQTEFADYPKPRVTTTVILGGRVLHKEQKLWESETETPEGQKVLEDFLNKQHIHIHKQVESDELLLNKISSTQAASSPAEMPNMAPVPNAKPGPARHPAASTPGVTRLFIVSKNGDLIAADDTGVPGSTSTGLFLAAAEFIEYWEETESERFATMLTRHREDNYLLVRHFGKYWGAEIAKDADPDETMNLFVNALEK